MEDFTTFLQSLRAQLPDRRLAQKAAEGIAERETFTALELLDITAPAVDIARIAEMHGVNVEVVPHLTVNGKPQSGHSWFDDDGTWQVRLNAEDSRTRKRFTLAHEFKHAIDDVYIDVLYRSANESEKLAKTRAEDICDHFAGCLLMPRPWLKSLWGNGYQDRDKLAALFGVSPAAMSVRLVAIGLAQGWPRHHWMPGRSWGEKTIREYLRAAPVSTEQFPLPCDVSL
jgi:Zn-dependent peptidase ImmA (M78 family)